MTKCSYCKRELTENSIYCSYCGKSQIPSPVHKSSGSIWWTVIVIAVIIIGVALVPILDPDLARQKPGDVIGLGIGFIVIGLIFWFLEFTGKVHVRGRASCLLSFPFMGFFILLFGLYILIFGANTVQAETCTLKFTMYDTYITLTGKDVKSLCNEEIKKYASPFQLSSYIPQNPIVCREKIDDINYAVVDTSATGTGGNLACKSLYETIQK